MEFEEYMVFNKDKSRADSINKFVIDKYPQTLMKQLYLQNCSEANVHGIEEGLVMIIQGDTPGTAYLTLMGNKEKIEKTKSEIEKGNFELNRWSG